MELEDSEAGNALLSQILACFCIIQCDIYSSETNNPPTSNFNTTVDYFSLMLCLLWVDRNLPWIYPGTHLNTGHRAYREHDLMLVLLYLGQEVALVTSSQKLSLDPDRMPGSGKVWSQCACKERSVRLWWALREARTIYSLIVLQAGSILVCFPPLLLIVSEGYEPWSQADLFKSFLSSLWSMWSSYLTLGSLLFPIYQKRLVIVMN